MENFFCPELFIECRQCLPTNRSPLPFDVKLTYGASICFLPSPGSFKSLLDSTFGVKVKFGKEP